jgi:hypothetical protein
MYCKFCNCKIRDRRSTTKKTHTPTNPAYVHQQPDIHKRKHPHTGNVTPVTPRLPLKGNLYNKNQCGVSLSLFHVCVWCVKHKVSVACWALICQTFCLIKCRCFVACISRTQLIVNIQIHLPALLWWATYATAQHRTPIHHTQNPKKKRRVCRCHQNSDPAKTQIPITIIQLHTSTRHGGLLW